jgi:formate-dependent nitrite reductase cytochrome c552 subunit
MNKYLWIIWGLLASVLAAYFAFVVLKKEDKGELLIGETTHGHYQIELSCSTCHTEAFGGTEVLQDACMSCHEAELKEALDSHPRKKFTNPRNADLIQILDARYCISCHTEHKQDMTSEMGLTLPDDYCYHCHEDVGTERESHKDLAFDSCATSGCHNFHDNRALYEAFLVKNANQPWLSELKQISLANNAKLTAVPEHQNLESSHPEISAQHPDIHSQWAGSAHQSAGVSCVSCHSPEGTWIEKPKEEQCATCHESEFTSFTQGKHGMRLAKTLKTDSYHQSISTQEARAEFKHDAMGRHQGCVSCHSAHSFDRVSASVDACLSCHNDEHSLAFMDSSHGQLWQAVSAGDIAPEQGVSCASCHLPRVEIRKNGTKLVRVDHNQNNNLRPNEKMVRPVCMQCHSLEFSLDALADEELIKNNFSGQPSIHVPSIDWALEREKE